MPTYHIYDKKRNGEVHNCAVCYRRGEHHQHHVGGRRYDDRAIWVCWECHAKIHANPAWAKSKGYLLERTNTMIKEKKTRVCKHSTKTMNKWVDGKLVPHCLFCGQPVKEMSFGNKKPVAPIVKKHKARTPVSKTITTSESDSTGKVKIGFEPQDPRIAEAEKLKRRYAALKRVVNRGVGSPEELAQAKADLDEVFNQMKALQATYEQD